MERELATHVALSRVHFPVTTLGPGRRAGIWFQGCSIRCNGCVSMDTWSEATPSDSVPLASIIGWLESLNVSEVEGITISGGEPFDQAPSLHSLLTELRQHAQLAHADLFVYSGYSISYLRRRHPRTLELIDAILAGPFVASRPTSQPWRGSSNQQLIVLTERATVRFASIEPQRALQVGVDGDQLWVTGIPRPGDLALLEARLLEAGVQLGKVSWRS